jgi:hypothetical protein
MLKGMAASPINAIVIPPDGEWTLGVIEQDLRTLQGIVGGYLEAVNTMYDEGGYPQVMFWCNEEGKLQNLPVNRRATALWYALNGGPTGDTLSGTVILTGGADSDGDVLAVPELVVELWKEIHSPE